MTAEDWQFLEHVLIVAAVVGLWLRGELRSRGERRDRSSRRD